MTAARILAWLIVAAGSVLVTAAVAGDRGPATGPAIRRRRGGVMDISDQILRALRKRDENGGRHLHHRHCIHNLPPIEQITLRGKTVEWWTQMIGPLPEQITPEQWETDPP